jgi:hypothetical protein
MQRLNSGASFFQLNDLGELSVTAEKKWWFQKPSHTSACKEKGARGQFWSGMIQGNLLTTYHSATVAVESHGFVARNLTFKVNNLV